MDDLFDEMDAEEFQNLSHPVPPPDPDNLATYIDHTLLKPTATQDELLKLCDEARQYGFATVCVNSANVEEAAALLQGSNTVPIAVVGFPLGASLPEVKAYEARQAIRNGAREIDTVINIGALKDRNYQLVLDDIQEVVDAVAPVPVKVIIETSQLDETQKIIACALSKAAGAAFVKTSTGFTGGGATAEDIALMRQVVGPEMGVKASGGVRTLADAKKMIAAGASRIGASASVAIVTEAAAEKSDDKKAE
ncbi:MAG: deoxyribose-phosphate aldolase [Myxococcaceae bacterium]|nr:deoxyribose-phosphate aldolase [Myxococcaceae bacterium]